MNNPHRNKPSPLPTSTAEQGEENLLSESALQRFIGYMTQFRNNNLKEGVKNIYGRHYAVQVAPEYQFKEQWENNRRRQFEENNYYEIIQSESLLGYCYTAIFLIFQVFLVWYYSTFRLLGLIQWQTASLILICSIVAAVVDCGIKFHLKYIKTAAMIDLWQVLGTFWESIAQVGYYVVNLVLISLGDYQQKDVGMYLLDFLAIWLHFRRAKGLFRHFKIRSYTTPYKNYFKIFDLFSNIITIEHFFALTIYLVSFYDSDRNWLVHYGNTQVSDLQRYFYSVYFSSTTIFTIGYGDIVPINNMEIICVLAMQMLGIAHFSYLINEIGFTLSSIRKEQQELQHNISTLSKMCEYYRIDQDLKNLAKEHLISNQKSFQEIEPEEENRVLMKLNDELRQTLTHENRLNIIKSSLFFICHWTKSLQTQVAKKLIKKILVPNQPALQTLGRQRIYIIKSGKLQIYTNNCFGFKRHFKKLLKTIQQKRGVDISDNIYGYTAVIAGRPVKLQAVSKDFTCVYSIDKNSFMECVIENKLDTEYYFQIKSKLDSSRYIEGFQAPAILNIRQHYRPSQMFLIKRYIHRMDRFRNNRREYLRRQRNSIVRSAKLFNNRYNDQIQTTSNEIRLTFYDHQSTNALGNRQSLNEQTTNLPEHDQLSHMSDQVQSKELIMTSMFQMMKEYQKYYKRFNATSILDKMEKKNYFCNEYVEPLKSYHPAVDYALSQLKRVAPTRCFTGK